MIQASYNFNIWRVHPVAVCQKYPEIPRGHSPHTDQASIQTVPRDHSPHTDHATIQTHGDHQPHNIHDI
jgi:hypothetical protein